MVKEIEALRRGLVVLDVLYEHGPLSLGALAGDTGLSKPTLLRILHTLKSAGYVRRGLGDRMWHVTTARSTDPMSDIALALAEASAAPIKDLCEAVLWPSDVGIYESAHIRTVETSRLLSPMLIRQPMNRKVAVLPSAMGRAILAWTNDADRARILSDLREQGTGHDSLAKTPHEIRKLIARVRAQGYAGRLPGYVVDDKRGANYRAIALPVMHGDRAVGAATLAWVSGAAPENLFVQRHLADLRRTVDRIHENLAAILR